MSFFTAADLSWMQEEVEKTMPDSCNILSRVLTSDGQGGNIETWGTAYAGVACRVDNMVSSDSDTVVGASERVYNRYVITVPHDTIVISDNRIETNEYTLAINNIDDVKSEQACLRIYAHELTEQP